VIRIGEATAHLTSREAFGLETLVDLSRLVPVEAPDADVVRLEVTNDGAESVESYHAHAWRLAVIDGCVRVSRSALGVVADTVGCLDELRSPLRDRIGRVPATENALVRSGLHRTAVISRAAVALREAVTSAAGRRPVRLVAPWPDGRRWAAAVTHDLDVVALWPLFTMLRAIELLRKDEGRRAYRSLASALRDIGRDPIAAGVTAVLDRERQHGVPSTWFVLCGTPTPATFRAGDLTYRPESKAVGDILRQLEQAGSEIGLHGSRETLQRDAAFADQRNRLKGLTNQPIDGIRQHFLRFSLERTPRAMHASGFRYDSTQGFPDRNGFRLGVADVIPTWDAAAQQVVAIDEIPFCWMDRALSKYQHIEDPNAWTQDGIELARECREVEGVWVGIWHPNLVPALGFPGALEAFDRLLQALASERPWFATLADIARWRSMRRSVRVTRVNVRGGVEAIGDSSPGLAGVVLEDADGRVQETVGNARSFV
jgi:peptidoglycan/xylan/chitin deacetylase (PgdA/CDA1 family)